MLLWDSIVGGLLKTVAPSVAEYYIQKQALKHEIKMETLRGKALYEKAKSERAAVSEGYDHDWETQSIKNSGWKDEATWVVLSIPMVCVFVPGLQGYILDGFNNLQMTPDWYRWRVVMIYGATFGIRIWRRKG